MPGLTVLHMTDRYLVVNKPAGLLSVPGKGERGRVCVPACLAEDVTSGVMPLVVHRLDMDTSGLMVLALDKDAQRTLGAQFEARTTCKRYIAIVDGVMEHASGRVELPIRLDVDRRPLQIVDHALGRPSLTEWRLLAMEGECSRVELTPVTGRTHQLRVHMAEIGRPILGDPLYGEQPRVHGLAPRLCLHASELSFDDPSGGGRVSFASPPPF